MICDQSNNIWKEQESIGIKDTIPYEPNFQNGT